MNNKKRNVLITGAAGLLGPQHATALIEKNFNVILIDKNLESFNRVKEKLNFIKLEECKNICFAA